VDVIHLFVFSEDTSASNSINSGNSSLVILNNKTFKMDPSQFFIFKLTECLLVFPYLFFFTAFKFLLFEHG